MNVWDDFDSVHIAQVWEELNTRFGFPIRSTKNCPKNWKQEFKKYYETQSHSTTETAAFIKFGNLYINETLNKILMRANSQSTFNNLVQYVIVNSASYKTRAVKRKQ